MARFAQPYVPPPPPPPIQPRQRTSGLALAAFILCLIPPTFILGVILAIIAMFQIRKQQLSGMGLVFTGLGIGVAIMAMTVVGFLVLLSGLGSAMDAGKRMQCAANLRGLANTLKIYQQDNNDDMPSVPLGYQGENSPTSGKTIDTQTSLWLLVASQKASPDVLICPSDRQSVAFKDTGRPDVDRPFPRVNKAGRPDPAGKYLSCSYSYQIPNGSIGNPGRSSMNPTRFAIMADRAPFNADLHLLPNEVNSADAACNWLKSHSKESDRVNSPNHAGQGQNVLFQDGHAKWHPDPWCGINGDNIFTRATGNTEADRVIGAKCGNDQLPCSDDDSVLLNIERGVYCTAP